MTMNELPAGPTHRAEVTARLRNTKAETRAKMISLLEDESVREDGTKASSDRLLKSVQVSFSFA